MHAAQQQDRRRQIKLDDVLRNKPYVEINAVGPYRTMDQVQRDIHVADFAEPLHPQQFFGDVLRGDANPGNLGKTNSRGFCGASWADILASPKAVAAAAEESVASKRRRVCANCMVPPIALRSPSCFRQQISTARMLRCGILSDLGRLRVNRVAAGSGRSLADFRYAPKGRQVRASASVAMFQERPNALQQTAPYSITSLASNCIDTGTSMPSALAVFMLMTSSNLVGACTGRSPGLAPFRMRST
jgi:hypothetical protein